MNEVESAAMKAVPKPEQQALMKSKLRELIPAFSSLRERGFSARGAVEWLEEAGQIEAADATKALQYLQQAHYRANKKQ